MAERFRDISIRQLRALAAVAASGSITAAAGRLHLTQPAVTLQLRNLQALAERIEAAMAACATSLEMMAGVTAGRISIGAVSTAKYFVPFAISGFQKLHPEVEISLTIGNRKDIGAALRGYDLDIAIMGRPPVDIEMDVRLIGDHPHVIIAPTAPATRAA